MNKTLFTGTTIFDATGADPYLGEVLVEGDRIKAVAKGGASLPRDGARIVDRPDCTLMPGLCDAHTHFSWTNTMLSDLGRLPIEEHVLAAMSNARLYLDCGYTMCVGAAAAKLRLDVVIRNAINSGQIVGPHFLANGPEIETTGGLGDDNFRFVEVADGPDEMRKVVRKVIAQGVDLIKLNLSGEEIVARAPAHANMMTDEEVAVAMEEAGRRGLRACAHARSAESVRLCLRYGIEIIYHASFIDEEALDELEAKKEQFFVVPALNWLYTTAREAAPWGVEPDLAQRYESELQTAIRGLREMHRRGIRVLPGGDYGFTWTPHGTYARDLEHFVTLLGFSPAEALLAATRLGGQIMGRADHLGQIRPGYCADLLLVAGNPLENISILQDRDKIAAVMKDGIFHKEPALSRAMREAA